MKRLLKILLILAIILVALSVGGLWYLNRWLKAPETHAQVEKELSKALKMPLKFRTLELSLTGGMRAEGVTVPDEGYQFFEAASFSAKHQLMPLLRGNIVLDEIVMNGPKFTMIQKADGKWRAPQLPADVKPSKKKNGEKEKQKTEEPEPKKKNSPEVKVERVTITNGSVQLFDKDNQPYLSATGLRASLKTSRKDKPEGRTERLEGRLIADRIVRHGVMAITEFSAGVSYADEQGVIIKDAVAKSGGGTISPSYSRREENGTSKFTLQMKVTDVDLTRAALDGDAPPPNLTGILSGEFLVRGLNDDSKTTNGNGTISLRNGTCRQIEIVKQYGEIVEEAASLSIPIASVDFQIWNGRLNVKPLKISAPPLMVTATGTARMDGKMDLAAVLGVDAKFLEQRPTLAAQFSQPNAEGMRELPFRVTGTMTKPKNDLKEKLVGSKDKRVQRARAIDAAVEELLRPVEAEEKKDGGKKMENLEETEEGRK